MLGGLADLEQYVQYDDHDVILFPKAVATKLEIVSQIEQYFESSEKTVL